MPRLNDAELSAAATNGQDTAMAARQQWMGTLAKAKGGEVAQKFAELGPIPDYAVVRPCEIGAIMVRGRAGGTGSPFGLGEMTVTRCVVQLKNERSVGHAYISGRDKRHAEKAAVLDAMLQTETWHKQVMDTVVQPLQHIQNDKREQRARKVAATKVEFFTMVRGED